jgi:rod shape determining protein RodA
MIDGIKRFLISIDWLLVLPVFALLLFGILAMYSLQINSDENTNPITAHLFFTVIGLSLMVLLFFLPYQIVGDYYKILLVISFVLLLSVLVFGATIKGTRGWFSFFGLTFQPVEIVKISAIIAFSKILSLIDVRQHYLKAATISACVAVLLIGLVMLQPDLGSAAIIGVIWLGYVITLPMSLKKVIPGLILIFSIVFLVLFFNLKQYQKDRLLTFIDPGREPLGSGYNVNQSMIAVGSGGLYGRGLSYGSQSHLQFLPEKETDFIFAMIAEELGFWGAGLLILLYICLLVRAWFVSRLAVDVFGYYLLLGFLVYIGSQTFINIGMNLGVTPVVGLPLPFVSSGGSSLLASLIIFGLILNVSKQSRRY